MKDIIRQDTKKVNPSINIAPDMPNTAIIKPDTPIPINSAIEIIDPEKESAVRNSSLGSIRGRIDVLAGKENVSIVELTKVMINKCHGNNLSVKNNRAVMHTIIARLKSPKTITLFLE
jgi:hypothetical protein